MYKPRESVIYKTSSVRTINRGEILSQVKTGVIEEAFATLDNRPCYWVEGEKELILHSQIIGRA